MILSCGVASFGRVFSVFLRKVFVGDVEVHRTKVIPMTLSPVWNETFFVSPETREQDETVGAGGRSVRFEIWDHDMHGAGDYLGAILSPVTQESGKLGNLRPARVSSTQSTRQIFTLARVFAGTWSLCVQTAFTAAAPPYSSSIVPQHHLAIVAFLVSLSLQT